jgi:hypothetical protein
MSTQLMITIMLMFFVVAVFFYCINDISEDPAR